MAEYRSNSFRSKEEETSKNADEKKVKKVITGKATTKPNEVRKVTDLFVSEDISNVKEYLFIDILVPAIKKAVSDIITNGVDMILYGGSGSSNRSKTSNYVSYRSYSDNGIRRHDDRDTSRRNSNRFDYEDIEFESRGDAELAREQMVELIDRYGFVTVADLYDMVDLKAPYTANSYGWTNIRSAEPIRVRGGKYILKLPKAMLID